ncbi:MAG: helix-turn-helix domain-containing protein [Ruminococcus sp.]
MEEHIKAVQRMQEYIEEHLTDEITLSDLSKASFFSPWYSYRLFCSYLEITPSEYIRRLRLSRSALLLKKGGSKVIDIAFEMGFGSADGFQRAFFREFGCNPKEYSKNKIPVPLFIPYGIKFREIRKEISNMENVQSVFVQLIKKPERKAVIRRGINAEDYFAYCEEVSCDVWGILMSMDSLCGEPVCMWLPEKYRKAGTSRYVQGVEVSTEDNILIPEGFDVIELPETEYLVFQGEPFAEENYCQAINAVQHAMDKYVPSLIGYKWDNENPRIQLEPRGERGYIEMRAVKKISSVR